MKKASQVIDAHCHIGSYFLAEDLIKLMDAAGVDKAVVFNHPWAWSFPRKDNYYNTNDYVADMQAEYPDVPIIIAHGAGYQNLYFPSHDPIKEQSNLYADTAMTTVDDSFLRGITGRGGDHKIIFGSDHFSRGHQNLYGNFFYVLERAFPDQQQRAQILGGNFSQILGLN